MKGAGVGSPVPREIELQTREMEACRMTSKPIRVLVVDADPGEEGALPRRTGEAEGIEALKKT